MYVHEANGKIYYNNLLLQLNQSRWFIPILCFILFPDAGCPGIESRWGRDFPHRSRTALGSTQTPI